MYLLFTLAPSAINGLQQIMYDNVTEYPTTINVLKRFNLWPELVVGVAYRTFTSVAKTFDVKTKECWNVSDFLIYWYLSYKIIDTSRQLYLLFLLTSGTA